MNKKVILNIIGVCLIGAGIVWILQGMNILLGSVMSGHNEWTRNGIITLIFGIVLLVWNNRRLTAK